jgi:hypothetical protein
MIHEQTRKRVTLALVALVALGALAPCAAQDLAESVASKARYTNGTLEFPPDTVGWVMLGADLGADYATGTFDPKNPGTIGVVQIEPTAYRYLMEHGQYADGTMLLLTFYRAEGQSDPQLRGFVQGAVTAREIHVIDRKRYPEEGRAFFVFPGDTTETGVKQPLGSPCVVCHGEHGKLDSTFAQFYPPIRRLLDLAKAR